MLDGYGRGVVTGGQIAAFHPGLQGARPALVLFACRVFAWLETQGYAHIEPLEAFVTGFVAGFRQQRED